MYGPFTLEGTLYVTHLYILQRRSISQQQQQTKKEGCSFPLKINLFLSLGEKSIRLSSISLFPWNKGKSFKTLLTMMMRMQKGKEEEERWHLLKTCSRVRGNVLVLTELVLFRSDFFGNILEHFGMFLGTFLKIIVKWNGEVM